jgi:hypothetical protein
MDSLTKAQLTQLAAEADRVFQRDDIQLDDEQVKQILQKLDLPHSLSDEAIAHLRQRQLLRQRQQRHKIVLSTIAIMVFGIVTTIAVVYQKHQTKMDQVEALQAKVTQQDSAEPIAQFDRQKDSEMLYRVTLKNVPVNDRPRITCLWSDPTDQIVYQSRYQTGNVAQSTWTTSCKAPLTPEAQAGTWSVRMLIEERPISDQTFVVK